MDPIIFRRQFEYIILAAVLFFTITFHSALTQLAAGYDRPVEFRADGTDAAVHIKRNFGRMPLYFIENQGQLDSRVAYYVKGKDKTIYFTGKGLTYMLSSRQGRPTLRETFVSKAAYEPEAHRVRRHVVKLDFLGANRVRPRGLERTGARISYFKGKPSQWSTGIPTYHKIVYLDLWPGIDLVYQGTVNRMKYTFYVHPGADPSLIRLAYRGAGVTLTDTGKLKVSTPLMSFLDDRPSAYQGSEKVISSYRLQDEPSAGRTTFAFKLGSYDKTKPLIIDPAVLIYCGYIGGSNNDCGRDIAVDSDGNVYVTGDTGSDETEGFPVTVGPYLIHNSWGDAFVAKISADGTSLVYCGYIGGNSGDHGNGIAVDSDGNAYVTGETSSDETEGFPVKVGPDLTHNGSNLKDAFVAKVNADGTSLIYCGYIGGSSDDNGEAIAVDSAGNAYVTGSTKSNETTHDFPVKIGPDMSHNGGEWDAFVAKVNADGTSLSYCGYIGGGEIDSGRGIAVDSDGSGYVVGRTYSDEADGFPVTVGPDLTFNGGSYDAFMSKVSAAGTNLVYCGFIGGSGNDHGRDIAVDSDGNAYVTGDTNSDETEGFPVNVGPDLTFNGDREAFVTKVSADGNSFAYCGYIGGSDDDCGYGIAVDSGGNAYVTGETRSDESSEGFPVIAGPDLTYNGDRDVFVTKVSADGNSFAYCGYIGGSDHDYGYGIAVDSGGNAYVTGETSSDESSEGFPVIAGPDLTFNGGSDIDDDIYVAKVSLQSTDKNYLITGILVNNDPGSSYSVFNNAVISLKADDIIQFIGSHDPETTIRFFVEDPMMMESRMVEVTTDGNGTFYYPATYFTAYTLPADAVLQFLFDNGSQITVSTKDYNSQLNDVVTGIDLKSIDLTIRVPLDQIPMDPDLMEYMRWRQNVNSGQTMGQYDWEAVERGRQKFGSAAEDYFLSEATAKVLYEGIVYGKQAVVCAAGIKAAGASGGILAPVAIKACAPLALHLGQTISHGVIDHYEDTGSLSSDQAEFWKEFSTCTYGITSFIAGGDPDAFDTGDFFYTVFDGTAGMIDSSLETSPEGVDYLRTTWQHGGFDEITLLIVPQKKKAMPWIPLLLLSDTTTASFLDHFDDGTHTDKWTVLHNDGTITESGTELHVQIAEPASGCDSARLDCNTTFSGQTMIVEARVKPDGY